MLQTTISQATPAQQMPTAKRLPLVGALPYIAKQQFDYLKTAHQEHGDIFRIDLGITDAVALNHPRHVQYVLR
ncbi:MAG: cytochrome P450, partial [Chloroflexota bacterium]